MGNLLPQDFRLAIKTMACLPQDLNFHLINKIPIEFKTYEVCHASLLIMGKDRERVHLLDNLS